MPSLQYAKMHHPERALISCNKVSASSVESSAIFIVDEEMQGLIFNKIMAAPKFLYRTDVVPNWPQSLAEMM